MVTPVCRLSACTGAIFLACQGHSVLFYVSMWPSYTDDYLGLACLLHDARLRLTFCMMSSPVGSHY